MHRYVLAIVLIAAASPVAAQPTPWSPERVTAGWVFTPAVALGSYWDSNPTMRSHDTPKNPEIVGVISPRTEIDFSGRRAKFSAGYSGTLERYQELSELTRYDQRGRLDARYQMTPRLLFRTQQHVTLTPTTDQLELEGLPFTRVGSRMVTSTGGFTYDFSPRSVIKTEYVFQWVDFDRHAEGQPDFRFLQGGHSHSPSAEYEYALTRRVKIGGLYVYRHMVIDAGEEIFGSQRGQGTFSILVTQTTTIAGKAGLDYVKRIDTLIPETKKGPSYGAGITQRIRQVSLDASFERQFMPSFGFGALTASQTYRAAINVPFASGRAYAGSSFTHRRTDPVVMRDVLVELESYWTNANFGYFVTRWLKMEAFLALTQQFSSARGDVDRTRVGVQFVTLKPVRIQ